MARSLMTRLTRSASLLLASCSSSDIILDHRLISPSSHPAHGSMLKSPRSSHRVRHDLLWTTQRGPVRARAADARATRAFWLRAYHGRLHGTRVVGLVPYTARSLPCNCGSRRAADGQMLPESA